MLKKSFESERYPISNVIYLGENGGLFCIPFVVYNIWSFFQQSD